MGHKIIYPKVQRNKGRYYTRSWIQAKQKQDKFSTASLPCYTNMCVSVPPTSARIRDFFFFLQFSLLQKAPVNILLLYHSALCSQSKGNLISHMKAAKEPGTGGVAERAFGFSPFSLLVDDRAVSNRSRSCSQGTWRWELMSLIALCCSWTK